jgi:hypothetical protein
MVPIWQKLMPFGKQTLSTDLKEFHIWYSMTCNLAVKWRATNTQEIRKQNMDDKINKQLENQIYKECWYSNYQIQNIKQTCLIPFAKSIQVYPVIENICSFVQWFIYFLLALCLVNRGWLIVCCCCPFYKVQYLGLNFKLCLKWVLGTLKQSGTIPIE